MSGNPTRFCDTCDWTTETGTSHAPVCGGTIKYQHQIQKAKETEVRTTSSTGGQKGVKLQQFSLIPIGPLTALAEHYGRGARKYATHQWRKNYEWSKSYDALQRHLTAWWHGEELDTCPSTGDGCSFVTNEGEPFEGDPGTSCYNHTGSHHLDAVMWHAFTLREFVETAPEHDDRYKPKAHDGLDRYYYRT